MNILAPVYQYDMGVEAAHVAVNYLDRYLMAFEIPDEHTNTLCQMACFASALMASKRVINTNLV